jgi:hypothetical protein
MLAARESWGGLAGVIPDKCSTRLTGRNTKARKNEKHEKDKEEYLFAFSFIRVFVLVFPP